MITLNEQQEARAKDYMFVNGMTRKEAVCLVLHEDGMQICQLVKAEGVSRNLIHSRLRSAKAKLGTDLRGQV